MSVIGRLKRCWVRDVVAETEFAVWERLWQVMPLLEDCRNLLTQLTAGISGDLLTADTQTVTASTPGPRAHWRRRLVDILRSHHAITYHVGISDVVEACECCAHTGTRMDVDQWATHVLGLMVEAFPVAAGIGSTADTVNPPQLVSRRPPN